jgi:3-methyl-2-oxobutanoate hydroxymethyltransferase
MKKITISQIQEFKGGDSPFATLTAYDFTSARIVDRSGIPLILVGDSAAMVVYGYSNTIPVSMEQMLFLVSSVARGVERALVVADMPFMSYQASIEDALKNAGQFIKVSGAEAIKLEGGRVYADRINAIVNAGIPVMAHIGLTPQSLHQMSGYRVQGKTITSAEKLLDDARSVEEAGAFSLVLEGMPSELAGLVTETVSIPTIGIGAGPQCDGQIQVFHDILGLYGGFVPKHTKQYLDVGNQISGAIMAYREEVESGQFPDSGHSAHVAKEMVDTLKGS